MTRLIDADEMLKRLESWNTDDVMDKALYNFTLNRIIEQPTVDAEPVRHGKWNTRRECVDGTFFTGCRCSECNYWKPMDIWKYCPNCGAKMGDEHGAD